MIEVRGLTARTGTAEILRGVDLDVPAGGVTALVGPSGSGKTTTALALLGEAAPGVDLRGTVRVAGVPVVDERGPTREAAGLRGGTVAYLPQHPGAALNPARRTGAVLRELARLHRTATAAGAARRAQLPDGALRRFPHQFSGGQRQRVALAQVLACGPRALVLDEPSTGLDTVTRLGLARELAALAEEGMALLLLSHDHDLVRALADHVVVLDGGRVARGGAPGDVLPRAEPPAPAPAPRPSGPVRLDVRKLTAWLRPGRRGEVLRDVSLSLAPGECLGVAGPSGGGKTTLARCIAGLHERHRGAIALDGTELPPLRRRDRPRKRRVQYVWQETRGSFDERRSVLDQVGRTAVRLRGIAPDEAAAEAADLLDRLGVAPGIARRPPAHLSGGELQRAAFARAALARPDVLICDEITTALDGAATARVLAEVARLRAAGASVLWIGHDLALLGSVADRLLVLDGGRTVDHGDLARVLDAPESETTRLLIRAARPTTNRSPT
ncbi:ABC transporter ATP-binding protein [Actinomadura algeriensis]|uniref:Peptide/nickel transport system ATP-binding protein n=1 Tax=Actinomadura algeriensis TaxID=1679523 RepID=A0ABR9JRF1_9ACTN|nr:ATP-binding cassette domain-containing protein [Actinomadura algeriensis]MBE1533142.1 peptide/nickel transport system ATP-binding protein [Actinomadura algeriensis]